MLQESISSVGESQNNTCGTSKATLECATSDTMLLNFILNPMPVHISDSGCNPNANNSIPPALIVKKKRGRRAMLPKMNNSERGKYYRKKHQTYENDLRVQVRALETDVRRLSAIRGILIELLMSANKIPIHLHVAIVREYYTIFRHGLQSKPIRYTHKGRSCHELSATTCNQKMFIEAFMTNDIKFGDLQGAHAVMEVWKSYSESYTSMSLELTSASVMTEGATPVILASGRLEVTHKKKILESISANGFFSQNMRQKLSRAKTSFPFQATFYFSSTARIWRHDMNVNFVQGFMESLGSLSDTHTFLNRFTIRNQNSLDISSCDTAS
uniref:Uncharacterized protein AlNc14C236G9402 n=1 Tax=Albugo laibachii Nc14 TaxID=890382 RepID=F0W8B8_9STRA|nr:conserved hypothetical protein [Albugo laibachii Nc14]CCA24384.1 conserved hypothetical protein [Albugo laibachii Nc14]|eukprot:CCA24384.1 conserved hypothetical protein [Albugo laibachii Nc14]